MEDVSKCTGKYGFCVSLLLNMRQRDSPGCEREKGKGDCWTQVVYRELSKQNNTLDLGPSISGLPGNCYCLSCLSIPDILALGSYAIKDFMSSQFLRAGCYRGGSSVCFSSAAKLLLCHTYTWT